METTLKLALALYQPDIPQNTGALLRLGACLDVAIHIIEPAGFRLDDKRIARAGLDYRQRARLVRHGDWEAFQTWRRQSGGRLIALTTKASAPYTQMSFRPDDILLLGRESAGLPEAVHQAVDARVTIPLMAQTRSLNVAMAAAIVLGEALRQTEQFPTPENSLQPETTNGVA
ncbi:MAG: tRNA (cytidine(34)-2'-O)-methyltransferase [Alphaproteobacteria bacterium]